MDGQETSYKEFQKLTPEQKTEVVKNRIEDLDIPEYAKNRLLNDSMIFIIGDFWNW